MLSKRVNQKLSRRYYEPYEIVEKIGPVASKLQLPNGSQVYPVFHVSSLKISISASISSVFSIGLELKVPPAEAFAVRRNSIGDTEVLIKWKNLSNFENSWEALSTLWTIFLTSTRRTWFILRGNADRTPKITIVYVRGRGGAK